MPSEACASGVERRYEESGGEMNRLDPVVGIVLRAGIGFVLIAAAGIATFVLLGPMPSASPPKTTEPVAAPARDKAAERVGSAPVSQPAITAAPPVAVIPPVATASPGPALSGVAPPIAPQEENESLLTRFRSPADDFRVALDSISFRIGEKRFYRLADLQGLKANEVCDRPGNTRWACGLGGRAAMTNAMLDKVLTCERIARIDKATVSIRCTLPDGSSLGERMVREGWALPINLADKRYAEALRARCRLEDDGRPRSGCGR